MSALSVSKKEGWQRGKNGIGPRMKNGHANLMTSQLPCFARRLSEKKQTLTTSISEDRKAKAPLSVFEPGTQYLVCLNPFL